MTRVQDHRRSLISEARLHRRNVIRSGAVTRLTRDSRSRVFWIESITGGRCRVVTVEAALNFGVCEMPADRLVKGLRHGVWLVYREIPDTSFRVVGERRHKNAAALFKQEGLSHPYAECPLQRRRK